MKKLRSEIPHPAKQFRHVVQQTLGAVQLADPQREGPKHTKERLDPPFVVDLVVMCHKALPNLMNAARKRSAPYPLRRNGTSDYIVSEQGLTPV